MESNLICKNEEPCPKMKDLNFEPKSFCSCIKEKSFNFTLEDLEDKRWQLINLQRVIVGLRQLQHKKRMTDAKQMKLAMKSKGRFIYPDIIITSEMSKSAAYENELVKNELNCFSGNEIKENFQDKFQECESKARRFFKTSEETLYKIFEIRIGHLVGANTCAFAIISSDALYVVEENFLTKLDEVLHENIDLILVGESERWVAILSKDLYSNTVGNECKREASFIQLDTGDSFLTRNIIKYLEMAIRRRLIALSIIIKKPDCQVRNGKLSVNSVCAASLAHPSFASRRIRFSYGRWLESLLPSVIPWSKQEVYYIENWLMEKLKIKKRPRVLACWLVFWENGSEFLCEKETQTCPSPCLDGGGMLYRFNDSCDKLPHTVYKIKDFCGCRRLSSHARPHSFELLKLDGYSIALAAPNEDTASQWLQCFLKIIGTSDDYNWEECVKLKPCQVIQTTESLILSYQENSKAILSLKDDVESIIPMKKDLKKRSVNLSSSQDQTTKINLRRMFSNGKMIPKLPSSTQAHN
ncbi:hypothetical protein Anas_12701 [Armadillidium nasatum]|uniref:PLEKHM2 PH domain-containing protein n=1 Tax=Armadillidium nasatum TaxID=96803 RepID=A0A5N5T6Y6_9CRUS|nr:hypothetical protein Anas_12701 [Armadillidium nasatum]